MGNLKNTGGRNSYSTQQIEIFGKYWRDWWMTGRMHWWMATLGFPQLYGEPLMSWRAFTVGAQLCRLLLVCQPYQKLSGSFFFLTGPGVFLWAVLAFSWLSLTWLFSPPCRVGYVSENALNGNPPETLPETISGPACIILSENKISAELGSWRERAHHSTRLLSSCFPSVIVFCMVLI